MRGHHDRTVILVRQLDRLERKTLWRFLFQNRFERAKLGVEQLALIANGEYKRRVDGAATIHQLSGAADDVAAVPDQRRTGGDDSLKEIGTLEKRIEREQTTE